MREYYSAGSVNLEKKQVKELLRQYGAYNVWANQRMMDCLLQLTVEQLHEPVLSSFPSIYKTVLHIRDAESMWWQRLKLQETVIRPSESTGESFAEICRSLLRQSGEWNTWIVKASDAALDHVFAYQNTKREQFKQPVYQVILHLFNHGTYHRGQLVTMLRQVGIENIPVTDFIAWSRTKKSATE